MAPMALAAAMVAVGHVAAWLVLVTLFAASLCLVSLEEEHRRRRDRKTRKRRRGSSAKRGRGSKKRRGRKNWKKQIFGLIH
jgi:membrane protein implicated in regulation of membrane protease activity